MQQRTRLRLDPVATAPGTDLIPVPLPQFALSPELAGGEDARMLRSMDVRKFFFDDKHHLRSAWRLCLFVVAFYLCSTLGFMLLLGGLGLVLRRPVAELANSDLGF